MPEILPAAKNTVYLPAFQTFYTLQGAQRSRGVHEIKKQKIVKETEVQVWTLIHFVLKC